jgi:hypothetical protein
MHSGKVNDKWVIKIGKVNWIERMREFSGRNLIMGWKE